MSNIRLTINLFALLFCFPSFAAEFTYSDLVSLIQKDQITEIETLLPLLPVDFRSSYVFMHESRSAQNRNVFPEWPRVILSNNSGTFYAAFTKNPATPPAVEIQDTLETIEYDTDHQKYLFREIVFKKATNPIASEPAINPKKCLGCHGADPRPLWESYNIWPGAFGSLSRLGCSTFQSGTQEALNYSAFITKNRNQDRYRFLPAEVKTDTCPDDKSGEMTAWNAEGGDGTSKLSTRIESKNFDRMVRLVTEAPSFERFKYVWAAYANGCASADGLEAYFPPNYAKSNNHPNFDSTLKAIIEESRSDFSERLVRFSKFNAKSESVRDRVPINFMDDLDPIGSGFGFRTDVAVFKLLSDRMGLSMAKMSPNLVGSVYDFMTPNLDFGNEVRSRMKAVVSTLVADSFNCLLMKSKSIEVLSK